MGYIYGVISGLVLIYALLFFQFKKKEDKDPNLLAKGSGFFAKMYSVIIRVFPLLMKLGHYVVLVLIIVQLSTVFLGTKCEDPYYLDSFGIKQPSQIVILAQWGLLIYGWFWVCLDHSDHDPLYISRMEKVIVRFILSIRAL